jgi:hypothetical protein
VKHQYYLGILLPDGAKVDCLNVDALAVDGFFGSLDFCGAGVWVVEGATWRNKLFLRWWPGEKYQCTERTKSLTGVLISPRYSTNFLQVIDHHSRSACTSGTEGASHMHKGMPQVQLEDASEGNWAGSSSGEVTLSAPRRKSSNLDVVLVRAAPVATREVGADL